ncbi:MAG: 50S ribosomal protein L33 [Candidatus Andersenbacteria bacterium]|nr:50S ribosomal protein L33 [Candidatus Andersenbacteria bacterium]
MSQDTLINLQCTECKLFNYHTSRNIRRADGHKLEINKFCKKCRKHQMHKEKAKK